MIEPDVLKFLEKQAYVIVATIDSDGLPHTSCKGVVAIRNNNIYLLDLFFHTTFNNLKNNRSMSITAVDENHFKGYCLKGTAEVVPADAIDPDITALWRDQIIKRITSRILRNIKGIKGHPSHPEAALPKPKYLIVFTVNAVINLSPLQS